MAEDKNTLDKYVLARAGDLKGKSSEVQGRFLKRGPSVETIRYVSPWSVGYRSGVRIATDFAVHSFDDNDSVLISA